MANIFKKLPHYLMPQQSLTKLLGRFANGHWLHQKAIRWFIKHYQVDMSEALNPDITSYQTFNDFFIRHLKEGARPIDANPNSIISPVDGVVSQIGDLNAGQLIQAKGHLYKVSTLFGDDLHRAEPFLAGKFATLYLSPKDYHRVHFPFDATLKEMIYVPGKLFAVKPSAVTSIPRLFAQNERLVMFFDTAVGPMAMVMVGALIVASIATSWQGQLARESEKHFWKYPNVKVDKVNYNKGDEAGYFKLGSTVILLFADKDKLDWALGLASDSPIRLGQTLATLK